jgi:hypothetical protein
VRVLRWLWRKRLFLFAAALVSGVAFACSLRSLLVAVIPGVVDEVVAREAGFHLLFGRVELELALPTAHLVAHDLVLAPADGGPPVATCTRAEAEIDLGGWFSRGVLLGDVVFDGVKAQVRRLPGGSLDLIATIAAARAKHPPRIKPIRFESLSARAVTIVLTDPAPVGSAAPAAHVLVLDLLALGIGTMRLDGPTQAPGTFSIEGTGGDLIDRISVSGEVDLVHAATAIGARAVLSGVDRTAVVCSLTRVASQDERLDLSGKVGLVVHAGPAYRTDLDVAVSQLTVEASHRAAFRLASASARVRFVPGEDAVLTELALEEPVVRLERLADRSLAIAGVVVAEPLPVRATVAARPALLDELEAALLTSRTSVAFPGASAGSTSIPLPELPEALTVVGGELHFPDDLAFVNIAVVERLMRTPGSAQLVASASATSPGVARSLGLGACGLLTDRALSASLAVSVAGVTTLAFQGASTFASGELSAGAVLTLRRETGTRVAGELVLREGRLADHGALRARLDRLGCGYSVELGAARPVVRVTRLAAEGAWTTLTRSAAGDLLVAGIGAGSGSRAYEPPIDLLCDRAELRGLGLHVALAGVETDVTLDATLEHVSLGEPGVATLALRGAATGLAGGLAIDGRVFTSFVSPAASLDVAATGLRSSAIRPPPGFALRLDERALRGRFGCALVPRPGAVDVIARVSSACVTDPTGIPLSLGAGRARVTFGGSPGGAVTIDDVELVNPFLLLEAGAGELTIARALIATTGAATPAPDDRATAGTLELGRVRIAGGELELACEGRRVRVLGIEARSTRRETKEDQASRPVELDFTAAIAGVASRVRVTTTLDHRGDSSHARAEIEATGIDLDAVSELWSGTLSGSAIHSGTLHAVVDASARELGEARFTGELAVRDLSLRDDRGGLVLGVAESSAHEIHWQRGSVSVGSLDVDRPHLSLGREWTGELVVAGLRTRTKHLALSDLARGTGGGDATELALPPLVRPIARDETRLEIEHASLGGGSLVFEDAGVRDASGGPLVSRAKDAYASSDGFVFGVDRLGSARSFFAEATLGDEGTIVVDGSLVRGSAGLDGYVTATLRGLELARVAPYVENGRGVTLGSGTLAFDAALTLEADRVEGDVRFVSRKPKARDAKPGAVDAEDETVVDVPFEGGLSELRVRKGLYMGTLLGTAVINALEQPLELAARPIEAAMDTSLEGWFLRKIRGPRAPLAAPVKARAHFSPGETELTEDAARAVADAARYARETDRIVSLRAVLGVTDRALAARAAGLTPGAARELRARFVAKRATLEEEHRSRTAAERMALAHGDREGARTVKEEVRAIDASLEELDVSLDVLGTRIEASGPAVFRGRRDEALRALARERVRVIRGALVKAGVDGRHVRVRLALLRGEPGSLGAGAGEGAVDIEVQPESRTVAGR